MISIVFSAYNEEATMRELYSQIVSAMRGVKEPYEIIAVNNASTDKTREELLKLSKITVLSIEKNLGQAAGLDAGIRAAKGEIICTLDADLQNDPSDIPAMWQKIREGYDIVVGWRRDRHDSTTRRIFSRVANFITSVGTGLRLHDYSCGIKMFKKEYLRDLHLHGVLHVFLPAILHSKGARIFEIPVRHHERKFGKSKYTVLRMSMYVLDLLSVRFRYLYPFPLLPKPRKKRAPYVVLETIRTAHIDEVLPVRV